ncbi:helix-turn-helix domain-containing protein [Brucella pseudintermedia]
MQAQALLEKGDLTAKEIAARLGVSVPTLYRYVPASTLKEDDS